MNLNAVRQILSDLDLRLTKSLGQNFLHDANQLDRIVTAAGLAPGDRVLEIGPGLGPLTELLVAQPVVVTALEIDQRLCGYLRDRFQSAPNFTLIHADALAYLRAQAHDFTGWKLVANLPYSVGSPILVEFALNPCGPSSMTVTLQLEVAQRLKARADGADYGVLTLLVQLGYEVGDWFKIPAGCFFPPPNVDSACITLRRREKALLDEDEKKVFLRLVKLGFSQRRKMAMKLLRQAWPEARLAEAFAALGLSPQARAETFTLEQFCALARRLKGTHA